VIAAEKASPIQGRASACTPPALPALLPP
jgi:hypothetical protein